jgi:hypothetical protein
VTRPKATGFAGLDRYNPASVRTRTAQRKSRRRHRWLYALPEPELPQTVVCDAVEFAHVETFKHDFFAATGLYRAGSELAVLKVGRTNDFLTLPMGWLGTFLANREATLYTLNQDLPGIPRFIGRVGDTGFMHAYVPGRPLGRRDEVPATFFDELDALLRALHGRHVAYVDLNKRQNILLGDDGRPYLIDFQISLHLPPRGWRGLRPVRWLLARFQQGDRYHALKHKRRLRPDLLTSAERRDVERIGFWIRLHRVVTRPLTAIRRRTLRRLHRADEAAVVGSAAK